MAEEYNIKHYKYNGGSHVGRPRISVHEARWREEVGKRIALALAATHLTQMELAGGLDATQPLVSQLIRGKRNPRSYLDEISAFCGVSVDYLQNGMVQPCDKARLTSLVVGPDLAARMVKSDDVNSIRAKDDGSVVQPPRRSLKPQAQTVQMTLGDLEALADQGRLDLFRLSDPVARALLHQMGIEDTSQIKVVTVGFVRASEENQGDVADAP